MFNSYSSNLEIAKKYSYDVMDSAGVINKGVPVYLYSKILNGKYVEAFYTLNDKVYSKVYER